MTASLEHRRALLTASLGFMQLDRWTEPKPPVMMTLACWMDSWAGIGAVVTGMAAQGCDLQLTEYAGENWRATFFVIGMAHSIVKGSPYEPTPWRAVQRAAVGGGSDKGGLMGATPVARARVHYLVAECDSAWADACVLLTTPRFRRFKSWREPYQLLMACLVYLHNALHEYPRPLHGAFRTPTRYWTGSPFSAQVAPLFNRVSTQRRRFSGMHLASISYRLPLALVLIALRLRRSGLPSPFQNLIDEREEDWRRGPLYNGRLALVGERCRRCEGTRRG